MRDWKTAMLLSLIFAALLLAVILFALLLDTIKAFVKARQADAA